MRQNEEIQLVVFDIGHVLIDVCNGWEHPCELAGIGLPPGINEEGTKDRIRSVVRRSEVGQIDPSQFADDVAAIIGLPADDVMRLSRVFLRCPYPGVFDLVDELTTSDAKTACLSNTNQLHWQRMNDPSDVSYLPLDRFDYRWASQMIGMRKPDAEIYEHAERQSHVAPRSILFFDNLPENVEAARRRGWCVELVEMNGDPVTQLRRCLSKYGVL